MSRAGKYVFMLCAYLFSRVTVPGRVCLASLVSFGVVDVNMRVGDNRTIGSLSIIYGSNVFLLRLLQIIFKP